MLCTGLLDALTRMETLLMSSIRSTASRPAASACVTALAAAGVLLGAATMAAAQADETCPADHLKVDRKVHESLHS